MTTTESTPIPVYPDLAGKVAVVTGGSGGIGGAVCLALAQSGVNVIVNGRNESAVQSVVRTIISAGGNAIGVAADCADSSELERLRERTEAAFGVPDFLVAFAGGGVARPKPIEQISEEEWRSSIDNNLTATFFTLKTFLPGMIERRGGSIVTMASAGARLVSGAPAAYASAKAGVIALNKQLASETGRYGIRANCISPSAVLTGRTRDNIPEDRQQAMLGAFPLGRLGVPGDVAASTLFLLSSASAWITGITLDVAGGRVML